MVSKEIIILSLEIVYFITALVIVFMMISENRNPLKTMSWTLLLLLTPFFGIIIYYFFGQDARRLRRISKKRYKLIKKKTFEPLDLQNKETMRLEYLPLVKLLNKNNDSALLQGSEVQCFNSGKEKFGSLIRDMENAQHHIHLQYYIFENDEVGNEIKNILIKKASEGIEVRVLYDDAANWKTKNKFYDEMQQNGIEVTAYLQVRFPILTSRVNYRNHRKIVVIDGKTGYIGGMNIADRYVSDHWKDLHFRIAGRGVAGLQSAFLIDWFSSGKQINGWDEYFPDSPILTNNIMQIVTDGPTEKWRTLLQATLHILSNAKKYVYIQTPYFLPTEALLQVLQTTALSGVDVRLMVPVRLDVLFVNSAAHSYFADIMKSGVKIYEYQPRFLHSKLIVVDDFISVVGSANMDFRSFEHNFEVNAYCYDESIASKLKHIFIDDMKDSKQIILKEWMKRPRIKKFQESVMRMFSPLL